MTTEPPIVIENRKTLSYLLCEAAELEHALLCEYLYAAFSLKLEPDDGLPAHRLPDVERWRSVLLAIAAEEMLHWALVNNLLTAIGSAPFVSRPHLPHQAKGYPPGVQLALLRFGEQALRHMVFLERPEGIDLRDAEGFEPSGDPLPPVSERELVPRGQEFATVGHLYRSIEAGLARLADKYGEDQLFIGPPRAQASPASFGWSDLVPIRDLKTAGAAIERIVEQGEGARGNWSSAHYGRFVAVLEEYLAAKAADPAFDPTHPVSAAGVRAVDGVAPAVFITDPVTSDVSDLFNITYDLLLQMIARYFAFGEESDEQLKVLADTSVGLMFTAIKPLGLLLATLPVGPEYPDLTAGANFQLAYRSNFLLPHRQAAWIRFRERLEETADFADGIAAAADVRKVLERVATSMRSFGRTLAADL
jgi:ferritin-like protein